MPNAAICSPAVWGYALNRPPAKGKQKGSRTGLVSDMPTEDKACPVCLIGSKPGCPFCWEFPADANLEDYAYNGQEWHVDEKLEPIHTNLTTASAVVMHRQVHRSYITCYVKSVPCGPVVQIIAERSQDVAFLHHLFRANSEAGCADLAVLFLPTMQGLYCLDNQHVVETDVRLAIRTNEVPLERYSLKKNGSLVVLLHFTYWNEEKIRHNIEHFITWNMMLKIKPKSVIHHFLDGIPNQIPGDDPGQAELVRMMNLQMEHHRDIARQERIEMDKEIKARVAAEIAKRQADALRRKREEAPAQARRGGRKYADREKLRAKLQEWDDKKHGRAAAGDADDDEYDDDSRTRRRSYANNGPARGRTNISVT